MTLKALGKPDFNQISLNQWFDRNPLEVNLSYNSANVAPHASTIRSTYTVPVGRKFLIDTARVLAMVETVATGRGRPGIYVQLSSNLYVVFALLLTNLVGDSKNEIIGSGITLLAGDTVSLITSDNSTGGSLTYVGSLHGVEYDA